MWIEWLKDIFDTIKKVTDSVKKFHEKDTNFLKSPSTQSFIQYLNATYNPEQIQQELWCSIENYIGDTHHNLFQNKIKKWAEFFEDITWIVSGTKIETTQLKEEIVNNENIWMLQAGIQMVSWKQSPIKTSIDNFLWATTETDKNKFLQSLWIPTAPQNNAKKTNIEEDKNQKTEEVISNIEKDDKKEENNYTTIVESVIQQIEWGYYHPNMNINGMGKSWETMMWIDRKHWWNLNTSDVWIKFRAIVDQDKQEHPELWNHNYKWWDKEKQLVKLAGEIIKPHYQELCSKYLSKESLRLINSDKKLLFNFIYCAWNGEWRFKKFANKINEEVKKWTQNTESLYKEIINYRKTWTGNSLIAQWGKKIEKILDQWVV